MDMTLRRIAGFLKRPIKMARVKLVIAQHIEDVAAESLIGPPHAPVQFVNVSS
ncbi:Unknown protein sequence [Pseudomonas amygdali pv. lachrymans]|nr:Unknown protein sequence [Pseudomonas amygdali pv. lachrymans]